MSDQNGEAPGGAGAETPGGEAPRNGVINVRGQDWAIGLSWYFYDTALLQQALSRLLVDYDSGRSK